MLSTVLMIILAVMYTWIAITALYERNWPRALYFLGAILITASLLWMGNRK